MVDLHRHDMFSTFDGFSSPDELAKHAKKLGHTSLGISNHGNTNGLIQHYKACIDNDIKPILGVEGYFLPKYKEQSRGYHLCLYAKNLTGYKNINTMQYEGEKIKFYNPIWTFDMLQEHSEGIICTSACVGSYSSQCIKNNKIGLAKKYLEKMKNIFGQDFYIEIQPYKVSESSLQEKVNIQLIKLANELNIKCILTSDSHYGSKDDFGTYLIMHAIKNHDKLNITATYKERYMPSEEELKDRFINMHDSDLAYDNSFNGKTNSKRYAADMINNLAEIENKCEEKILEGLQLDLPKIKNGAYKTSYDKLKNDVKQGLQRIGKINDSIYIDRAKEELNVIKYHGFEDYFLIVADYTQWAKDQGIAVGAGRGSVCNSLVAYLLKITNVDSIKFGLDFRRFMRIDKTSYPDIDLDFATDRRQEVIDYIINKYPQKTARVSSYGMYNVDNTINALANVCGLKTDKSQDDHTIQDNKIIVKGIKKMLSSYKDDNGSIDKKLLFAQHKKNIDEYNLKYNNIIKHFFKFYKKINYIGTHAAGVIVTNGNILDYTALRLDNNKNIYTAYDLEDLNDINLIKFDILGLKTMQSLDECRKLAGKKDFDFNMLDDKKLFDEFRLGNTTGIFQFEKNTARNILNEIHCDCFDDVVATNAMNRPGPLSQKMPEQYGKNKLLNSDKSNHHIIDRYLSNTYGTIVYQEQLLLICVNVGKFTWPEADFILKANKQGLRDKAIALIVDYKNKTGIDLKDKFIKNAMEQGIDQDTSDNLWDGLLGYTFNRGHAVGYSLISLEEMHYKVYYPTFYWYTKIKYARDEVETSMFCDAAAKDNVVIFLPHVNYSDAKMSIRKVDGEYVLQHGLCMTKGIGQKAAEFIVNERKKNGIYTSYDNFIDRCQSREITTKTVSLLKSESTALVFDKKVYISRIIKYNSTLYARSRR